VTNKHIEVVDIQKTKIIATLGPASSSKERLLDLVKAGVDVFRLNFSHGKHEDHQAVIERIVEINKTYKQHVSILGDLQGPKLRVGEIKDNRLEIKPGDVLTFTSEKCVGTMEKIYMSYEQFPQDVKVGEKVQKMIIKRCIQKGKPVIVATQMMESMITNPSPTRAEITDVANAVLDGTDAVMLSGETSVGAHPAKVVEAMNKIIYETEKVYEIHGKRPKASEDSPTYLSDKICLTASKLAEDIDAKGLIGVTVSGYTAFKMSSFRPSCPIFIFSPKEEMLATLNLLWGVKCFHYDKFSTTDETIADLAQILKDKKKVKQGDIVVNTAAMPLHKRYRTNMLKITMVD